MRGPDIFVKWNLTIRSKTASLTATIFLKIIVGVLSVLVVALTAVDVLASKVAERTYHDTLHRELEEKSRMLALLSTGDLEPLKFRKLARESGARLTLIDGSGRVVRDSESDPNAMENHAERPEFTAALHGRTGSDMRKRNTL